MIVPDVNLLLYANLDATPQHERARRWFEALLSGDDEVGLAPAAMLGFVRIATNRRVYLQPLSVDDAVGRVRAWLALPRVLLLEQTEEVVTRTLDLLQEVGTAANLTTDAQLAAHALAHRATIATADSDFARFQGVKWMNPLRPSP